MTQDENSVKQENTQNMASGIQHGFDTGYAIAYGVNEAIMIKNLQFFITANANRGQNFHEGRFWTYDKLQDFPKHFPYWSIRQVRTTIDSLIKQNVIIKGEFNKNKFLRTQWYAFVDQEKFIKYANPPEKLEEPEKQPDEEEIKKNSTLMSKLTTERCQICQLPDVRIDNCIYTSSISSSISSSPSLKVSEERSPIGEMPAKAGEMKSKSPQKEIPEELKQLGDTMLAEIVEVKADFALPKTREALYTTLDQMLRIDKRTIQQILDVFRWALADEFWQPHMLKANPAKYLRDKNRLDQLEAKMKMKPKAKERKFLPSSNDAEALRIMKEMSARAL